MTQKEAVFLDRDGVINRSPAGRYVTRWSQFRFLPGVLGTLRLLHEKKRIVIIVSNQSGVGRKAVSKETLGMITKKMLAAVRQKGGHIHAVYYCPHRPKDRCPCRKPRLGMLKAAARRFSIDLNRSFLVGDNRTDILTGSRAGCKTILVLSGRESRKALGHPTVTPDRIAKNLAQAVHWILRQGVG